MPVRGIGNKSVVCFFVYYFFIINLYSERNAQHVSVESDNLFICNFVLNKRTLIVLVHIYKKKITSAKVEAINQL
jgi:hypothetical protein